MLLSFLYKHSLRNMQMSWALDSKASQLRISFMLRARSLVDFLVDISFWFQPTQLLNLLSLLLQSAFGRALHAPI